MGFGLGVDIGAESWTGFGAWALGSRIEGSHIA